MVPIPRAVVDRLREVLAEQDDCVCRLCRAARAVVEAADNDPTPIDPTRAEAAEQPGEDEPITADQMRRAVLQWASRFIPGDRWDSEDVRDLETALGGTVENRCHHRSHDTPPPPADGLCTCRHQRDDHYRNIPACATLGCACDGFAPPVVPLADKDARIAELERELERESQHHSETLDRLDAAVADCDALADKVRALADEWAYKGEFGWGPWQAGEGPDIEGQILDQAASRLRALLVPPAVAEPTDAEKPIRADLTYGDERATNE
jgi:hypothetical protein